MIYTEDVIYVLVNSIGLTPPAAIPRTPADDKYNPVVVSEANATPGAPTVPDENVGIPAAAQEALPEASLVNTYPLLGDVVIFSPEFSVNPALNMLAPPQYKPHAHCIAPLELDVDPAVLDNVIKLVAPVN